MPTVQWALVAGRPVVEVLVESGGSRMVLLKLLADTGAGAVNSGFELLLRDSDCLQAAGPSALHVPLGGAYRGLFPVFWMRVEIPHLQFSGRIRVIGVPAPPSNLDGIACFRFLNRFSYGNFGRADQFGLEA